MNDFRPYRATDFDTCLSLFDSNCPEYFASNERADFEAYLSAIPDGYSVFSESDEVVAAYGVTVDCAARRSRLQWIIVHPDAHGRGLGSKIMKRAISASGDARVLDIAASHKSEPFFARYKARRIRIIEDGWELGMHRVDMEIDLSM